MTKKGLYKLITRPHIFLRDYIKKKKNLSTLKEDVEFDNRKKDDFFQLVENYTNVQDIINIFIEYLLSYTCFIQTISNSKKNSTIRIIIKSTDIGWILKKIDDFEYKTYKVYVESIKLQKKDFSIIRCYIFDDKYRYMYPTIELDPWLYKSGRIYTNNYNPYITHADEVDINKTVYSPNPYFLQGEIDLNSININKAFNLADSAIHDFSFPIDIVYTWVDGNDPKWIDKKNYYLSKEVINNNENIGSARFEQINELLYSLRSVEKYFKCYRKIFIVTDGQVPYWLDVTHPSIYIIDHKDIFIEQDHLPVFNSHAIEANLKNIPGLSEHFIYMNDDVFFWNNASQEDFFYSNGLSKSRFENISNINAELSDKLPAWKSAALQSNKLLVSKYSVAGYSYHQHCPHALRKNVLELMWKEFHSKLIETSASKFRSISDVSPVSFLYHYFSFIQGKSIYVEGKTLTVNSGIKSHLDKLEKHIYSNDFDFVCINDGGSNRNEKRVINILNKKFPNSAKWERLL